MRFKCEKVTFYIVLGLRVCGTVFSDFYNTGHLVAYFGIRAKYVMLFIFTKVSSSHVRVWVCIVVLEAISTYTGNH